ncbi:hypothetical protein EDB87DRAFT_1581449 [Lactarius vividus]|nr:hypothetical protein EDB87DRAFT_1581449 [Lactarius vividus]
MSRSILLASFLAIVSAHLCGAVAEAARDKTLDPFDGRLDLLHRKVRFADPFWVGVIKDSLGRCGPRTAPPDVRLPHVAKVVNRVPRYGDLDAAVSPVQFSFAFATNWLSSQSKTRSYIELLAILHRVDVPEEVPRGLAAPFVLIVAELPGLRVCVRAEFGIGSPHGTKVARTKEGLKRQDDLWGDFCKVVKITYYFPIHHRETGRESLQSGKNAAPDARTAAQNADARARVASTTDGAEAPPSQPTKRRRKRASTPPPPPSSAPVPYHATYPMYLPYSYFPPSQPYYPSTQ